MGPHVYVKRVYESAGPTDGLRVLVDRLWPRGLTRERAAIDEWLRDIAPSTSLRRWYGHRPERAPEFRARYLSELAVSENADALGRLRDLVVAAPAVTLLTATADIDLSHATVLLDLVLRGEPGETAPSPGGAG